MHCVKSRLKKHVLKHLFTLYMFTAIGVRHVISTSSDRDSGMSPSREVSQQRLEESGAVGDRRGDHDEFITWNNKRTVNIISIN